jgi:Ni/Co efflux regulator RcnB
MPIALSDQILAWSVAALAITGSAISGGPADAAVYGHHSATVAGPNGVVHHGGTTVATPNGVYHAGHTTIDRGRSGWWHGQAGFVGYTGARAGYYFAPGYGYYAIPRGYTRTTWVVGATLPPVMRSYVVVQPTVYGLAPAPAGYGWYYAGTNLVLVSLATGVIAQSIAGGW